MNGDDEAIPLEVLERKLTNRCAEMAAAEAEWMEWLAEYDERKGWAEWGCIGPSHWLSWKCGFSPSAARERVRVATALRDLPLMHGEFRAGRLSYSKVQALTRVANEHNEAHLVALALNATGAQLAKICAGYRSSAATDEAAADALATRGWRTRDNHDGTSDLIIRVSTVDAKRATEHLEREVRTIIDDAVAAAEADDAAADISRREAIAERGGIAAVRADAAVALLTGEAIRTEPTPADVTLIVGEQLVTEQPAETVTPATDTCAQAWGHALAPSVGDRLLCDPRITALVESAEAGPLAVGRSARFVGRRLRRALERRDHAMCRFPGCHATQRLHAHHIVHWRHGGPTELENLILVCHFHHHLVHEGGWNIDRATGTFIRPDGAPIDPHPEHLRAGVGLIERETQAVDPPGPLEPPDLFPLDLSWTTAELHQNEAAARRQAV